MGLSSAEIGRVDGGGGPVLCLRPDVHLPSERTGSADGVRVVRIRYWSCR